MKNNQENLSPTSNEYLPHILPKRKDFVYLSISIITAFVSFDLIAFYFPSWRNMHSVRVFPNVLSFIGITSGAIVLFRKLTAKIVIDRQKKKLTTTYITLFKEKQLHIELDNNVIIDFNKYKNGRGYSWILKISNNGKLLFREKENSARYSKEQLEKIYKELLNLNK